MKRLFFIVFALIFLVIVLFFSIHTIDSMKGRDGSMKLKNLIDQATVYLGYSPQKAYQKALEAFNLAQKEQNNDYSIQATELLGEVKNIQGDTKQALLLFTKAYQYAQRVHLSHGICKTSIDIGEIYYNWGQYDSSLVYFKIAETIAQRINDKQLIADRKSTR